MVNIMSDGIFPVKFLKKQQVAKDAWRFFFEKQFPFFPGQFVTIFFDKDSRDFTLASSPLEKDFFTIVTKEGKSDFKKKLFSLVHNSQIFITKPAGGFTIADTSTSEYIFLAGGIGITPFFSMILHNHQKNLEISMTLISSFSKKTDVLFFDELLSIAKENQKIKIIYTLTQDTWEKEQGRISEEIIKKHVPLFNNKKFFIAGKEEMVEDMQNLLKKMGINESQIRVDIFTGY